ncbi:hypothetical protein PQX77_006962 [Marasmius sp. AFHP31]|nr:hypothetical protein PQX77_006962 [Marasmius sp. AFHP31]
MGTERVDDGNLDRLIYANGGKGWKRSTRAAKEEYLSTSHGSPQAGSSVTFRFNGTSVEVKGTVLEQGSSSSAKPLAIFVLDFNIQSTFKGELSNDTVYDQQFYFNSPLSAGEHALTMTLMDPESLLWLDYIDYTPVTAAAANSPPASSTTDGATATQQPQNNADTNNGVSKGLVAGISVLAAVLMALIVLGLVWWLLQRRKRGKQGSEETQSISYTHPSDPTSPVQSEFRQGRLLSTSSFAKRTECLSGHVHPYPTSINPPVAEASEKPQIPHYHVANQYSSASSGIGNNDGRQPQENAPPYRKRG